jgi:hypothetical protein
MARAHPAPDASRLTPDEKERAMSYLIELQTPAGVPGYVIAKGNNHEEVLANVHEQLGLADEDEVVVLAVHTVH